MTLPETEIIGRIMALQGVRLAVGIDMALHSSKSMPPAEPIERADRARS